MNTLTLPRLLVFFVPLALSWVLMSVDGPVSLSLVGMMSDPKVQAAAFLVMFGISLWIESPVIDLLTTGNRLATDREAIPKLERFTLAIMGSVTVVHAAVAFTPLYDLVARGILGAPPEVQEAARIPLQIMTPWSAAIGWRRWRQGLMIREGITRPITMGTIVRVIALCAVGYPLTWSTQLPGLQIAAYALAASVVTEAVFIHYASQGARQRIMRLERTEAPLTYSELARFHFPLTASTMVTLSGLPLVGAALAQLPNPVDQMAGWQAALSAAFCFRTSTFAIPEVVVTLADTPAHARTLRRFSLGVGGVLTAAMLVTAAVGLDRVFFNTVLDGNEGPVRAATTAFLFSAPLPILSAAANYIRGRLTRAKLTVARLWAIGIGITMMWLTLRIGVEMKATGAILAPVALSAGALGELLYLSWAWYRADERRSAPAVAELAV